MSLNSEIQNYNDGLLDAYSAVNTKGGTVPANKNLDNLPTAINSVPSGGGDLVFAISKNVGGSNGISGGNQLLKKVSSPIVVDANVTDLSNAFYGVTNLEGKITLTGGGSITTMAGAFEVPATMQGSLKLTEVDLSGLSFSSNGVSFADFMYKHSSVTSVKLPHNIKVLNLSNAFRSASSGYPMQITSLDLSGWDTSACSSFEYCFGMCNSLTRLDLSGWTNPNTKSTTGMFSINGNALESIIIDSSEVFNLSASNAISSSPIARGTCYVYVPDSLVSSYQAANYWSTYASQIKGLSELPA